MTRAILLSLLLATFAGDQGPLSAEKTVAHATRPLAQRGPWPPESRAVAITIDDLPTVSAVEQTNDGRARLTASLLAAITAARVPAIGFVNENKLGPRGQPDPARVALMQQWLDAGLELGNHTWSHVSLHRVTLAEYEAEIVLGDSVLRSLLAPSGRTPRYFRHPFLQAGRETPVRDSLLLFLTARDYRIAPVTIDNGDYLFAAAYDRRIAAQDSTTADSIVRTYIRYMDSVFAYYERQSVALLGREPVQTLLMHANALNARSFGPLAEMMTRRGYRFVSLDEALTDPAYDHPDEFRGNGGISWLHRWAWTEGKRGAFFAGEPEVPAWIERASQP
jgi:peptidoglycan/xylan/chitin deacetylase (PgdA/CDA1 family)